MQIDNTDCFLTSFIILKRSLFASHKYGSCTAFARNVHGVPKKMSGHNFVETQPKELKFCMAMSLVSGFACANFGFHSVPIFVVGSKDIPKTAMQT